MCGIIGYTGKGNATPFLVRGLELLEYRGYDSAGLYVDGRGAHKRSGKVAVLKESLPTDFSGPAGIAHTRWATHGAPTEVNSHPHTDALEKIWLVHNGIIENYREIRDALEADGVAFRSETDTEALAQLIGKRYTNDVSLEEAVALALAEVRGAYSVAVMSVREPQKIVAARCGSPLLIGIGDDAHYLASDATPLLSATDRIVYLDDGELAILTPDTYRITTLSHEPREKVVSVLDWNVEVAQKKGYEHFMLKEIMEIPEVLGNSLRGRIDESTEQIVLGGLKDVEERLQGVERVILTGCGSAYYAGMVGELLIEELTGLPAETEIASEFRYRRFTADPRTTVLIAVSQSGETADTLEAVREAKRHGMLTLGVVNAVGSSISRETDAGVYNHAGPEIGVASTKGFVSQVAVLTLIASYLKQVRGEGVPTDILHGLTRLPDQVRRILESRDHIATIASKHSHVRDALFLGRKFQYPVAYEGALKLKEVSYAHAEAYGAGEMKHGPLALIDESFPTVALMPQDSVYEKTRSNIEEIRARNGPVIVITTEGSEPGWQVDTINVPYTHEALLPILTTIPLQLFAYYVAHARGLPIDMPRNLAKSVTVE
jgi:glucosamine--fructose-6-phosphate aminotransferase (isomerizing)